MWWAKHRAVNQLPAVESLLPARSYAVDVSLARAQLKAVEERAYKTYRARQSASERLGSRARAWNWALVALSTSTTIAAIGMLTDSSMYGPNGSTLLVCVAILSLVFSLTTANRDYSGRSRNMFINYRKVQKLSVQMEELGKNQGAALTEQRVKELSDKYQAVLDETENHSPADHLRHFSRELPQGDVYYSDNDDLYRRRKTAMRQETLLTSMPYFTLLLPLALLVPLIISFFP